MDRTRYDRLFAVFDRARELSGSERAEYLERACGDDATLRHEVEELLGEDENESNPIGTAAADGRRAQLERILVDAKGLDAVGESLGPFRILRRIGAGGMGTVYEAEQDRPHRRVALKVLHPTHAFGDRLRRFRRESEILARLHHPGIAQVYAAETVDHGFGEQPWFAMELVDGLPLVDFAERRELARDERLELVALVCDAVQHAHDSGIVHRDLKPDNVLVDDEGRPKVLDFGVAHASDPGAQLSTIQTGQGEVLGTLTHMAPEQLAGDPDSVGTPADVWALGVIVFELLTGRLPYELAGLSLTAAIRLVTDREPMRLSKLDPRLRGDLDTIVARALETEPARRYPSPAALAADLRRFLESRPITARPASKSYRARKFVQRNPVLVAGVSATVLAILVGSAASAFYARRAASERDLALEREAEVKAALYGSVRTALATDPWRARLDLERIGPDERDWVWCWLARQTPLLLEPLGPQPGRRFYSPLPLFADERTLIEMFPNNAGGYMPARIDLASPDRAEFLLEGAHAWGLSVADGEARMLDPDGWLGIDLRTGDVDRRAHDGYYSPWAGPDGLAVGQTGGEAEQRLVVSRSDRSGVVRTETSRHDVHHFVELANDGRYLCNPLGPGVVVYATDPLEQLGTVGPSGERAAPAFRPDGERLAVASQANGLQIFDLPGLTERARFELPPGRAYAADWSAPSDRLAVSLVDTVVVVDPESGATVAQFAMPWSDEHEGHRLDLSPSGRQVSLFAADQYRPWVVDLEPDVPPRAIRVPFPDWTYFVTVSPEGDLVARLTPNDPIISVHDAWTGKVVGSFVSRSTSQSHDMLGWLAFSADGRHLVHTAYVGNDKVAVRRVDLFTGDTRDGPSRPEEQFWLLPSQLLDDFVAATGDPRPDINPRVCFVGADRLLAGGNPGSAALVGSEGTVQRLPPTPFAQLSPFHRNTAIAIDAHPDVPWMAITDSENSVELRDADSGDHLHDLSTNDATDVLALAIAPGGDLLAAGFDSGRIIFFETRFWKEVLVIEAHDDYVYDLEWSPDGTRLFSASGDASLKIWDSVHPIARRFQAEDREARTESARVRLAELTAELGDAAAAVARLIALSEDDPDLRLAARRACLEAWTER